MAHSNMAHSNMAHSNMAHNSSASENLIQSDHPLISVFGSSSLTPDDAAWQGAERLGTLLARAGYGVLTGGYSGLMEAVSRGARSVDGIPVIGITAPDVFKQRDRGNPYLTREIAASHLLERIHLLSEASVASVALPGSIGTLTELMIVWNLAAVAPMARRPRKPIVTVGEQWRTLVSDLAQQLSAEMPITMVDAPEEVLDTLRTHL